MQGGCGYVGGLLVFMSLLFYMRLVSTRGVASSRIVRCTVRTRKENSDRRRVTGRLLHGKMAVRRIGHVGHGVRDRGGINMKTSLGRGSHAHATPGNGNVMRLRDSGRDEGGLGTMRHRAVVVDAVSFLFPSSTVVCVVRTRGGGRVFNRHVFRGGSMTFRTDCGLPAPTGCGLKPNSRITVSV